MSTTIATLLILLMFSVSYVMVVSRHADKQVRKNHYERSDR